MKRIATYLIVLSALLAASCSGGKGRVIPKAEMARIYADMFLADKQLRVNYQLRRVADTSRVYEAIFARYGYTIDDYNASQEHYILDARRYVKILKKSVEILEKENKVFKDEKARIDAFNLARQGIVRYAPNRIYLLDTIACADSLLFFDFQEGLDTVFEGPRIVVAADTAAVAADSVRLSSRDSLKLIKPKRFAKIR